MGSNEKAPTAAGPVPAHRAAELEDHSSLRGSDPVRLAAAAKGMSLVVSHVAAVVSQLSLVAANLVRDRGSIPGQQAIILLETSVAEVNKTKAALEGYAQALREQAGLQTAVSGGNATDKSTSVTDAFKGIMPAIQGLAGSGAGFGASTSQTIQPSVQQSQQPFLPHTLVFGREIERLDVGRPAVEGFVKKFGLDDNVKALVDALAPATTAAEAKTILEKAGAELLKESGSERSGETVDPQQLGHWGTILMGEAVLRWAQSNGVNAATVEELLKALYEAGRGTSLVKSPAT